jgi:hypothetical protein
MLGFEDEKPDLRHAVYLDLTLFHLGKSNSDKSKLYFELLKTRVNEDKEKKDP